MLGMSPNETMNLFTTISSIVMLGGVGYAVYFLATKKKRNVKQATTSKQEKCLGCGKLGEPNTVDSKFKSVFVCKSCQTDAENNAKLNNPDP